MLLDLEVGVHFLLFGWVWLRNLRPYEQRYLRREVGGKTILVGHSMGGKVAMLASLAFPELIQSMLIVDGTASTMMPFCR